MTRPILTAAICTVALSGCAQPVIPQQPPNGRTACLVRGLTGPVFSWLTAGEPTLRSLGYAVEVHDMGVEPAALDHCDVVVAHSWGAPPALKAHGPRWEFIVDGFAIAGMRCHDGAQCVSWYNTTNVTGWHLDGAENIAAEGVDALPFIGHVLMPLNMWGAIADRLMPQVMAEARK